jgi:hypothetical protein
MDYTEFICQKIEFSIATALITSNFAKIYKHMKIEHYKEREKIKNERKI